MAIAVGSVHVDVVPSTRDFVKDMRSSLLTQADAIGKEMGQKIGKPIADDVTKGVRDGLEGGVDQADVAKKAEKKGKTAGDAFGRAVKREIAGALQDLPDVEINGDLSGVMEDIAIARQALSDLSDKTVGIDVSGKGAIAEIQQIRSFLASIQDESVTVALDFDINQARARLGVLEKEIASRVGGQFDKSLRSGLESALGNLPDVEFSVDANADPARNELADIRATLQAFSDDANININIDADQALAGVDEMAVRLQALVNDNNVDIKIRLDAEAALGKLTAIGAGARGLRDAFNDVDDQIRDVDRSIGAFAASMRAGVESALRNLPDFDINIGPAREALAAVRSELAAFSDLTIGIDLNSRDALAGIAGLISQLQLIETMDPSIDVQVNAAKAIAELQGVQAAAGVMANEVENKFQKAFGSFASNVRSEIAKAAASLPSFEINADTRPALRQVSALKSQIETVNSKIYVEGDTAGAMRDLDLLLLRAREIDLTHVDISVSTDVGKAIAELEAAKVAASGIAPALNQAGDSANNLSGGTQRWRLILAAVLALLPLIAGALLALSSLIALVAAPIAAIALGMDGIKAAALGLGPAFTQIKTEVSAAFEQGLRPALEQITQLIPTLSGGLGQVATSLGAVAQEVASVATETPNISLLAGVFDQVSAAVQALGPLIGTVLENFLKLANIGGPALTQFLTDLNGMAIAFGDMIARLQESGAAQAAIAAVFDILAQLVGLVAPLTELGAVLLASLGPPIASALGLLGIILTGLASALDVLPEPLATIASAALVATVALLALGKGALITAAFSTMAGVLGTAAVAIRAVGMAFATSLSLGLLSGVSAGLLGIRAAMNALKIAFLSNPIGILLVAITTILPLLFDFSSGAEDAAAAAQTYKTNVEELASALTDSGGRITSQIVTMNETQLAAANAGDAFKTLGLSVTEAAVATAAGGVTYDAYLAKLRGIADQEARTVLGRKMLTNAQVDQIAAAKELIPVIEAQRAKMIEAAAANDLLTQKYLATGVSMVGGLASAKAYETAISGLGTEMATASSRAKDLDAALRALDGGTLTAAEASQKLNDAIRGLDGAFKDANAAIAGNGLAMLNSAGAIDTATEAGSKLQTKIIAVRDGMIESAAAAFTAAGGMTNIQGASAAASTEVDKARKSLYDQAAQAGITGKAADDLVNIYLGFPGEIVTLLTAQGVPQTTAELLSIKSVMDATPTSKEITVRALSAEAFAVLDSLGIKVERLPNGNVRIEATDETRPVIDLIIDYISKNKGNLPVGTDNKPALAEIPGLVALLETHGVKLPTGTAPAPAPQAGANQVRTDAEGKPAEVPVTTVPGPNVGAGVTSARQMAGQTPAEVPTNTVPGPGVLAGVDAAKGAASGAVADVPTNTIAGPGINTGIEAAKAAATGAIADVKVNTIAGNLAPGIDAAKAAASVAVADIKVNTIAGNLAPGIDAAKGAATAAVANVPVNTTAGPGVRTGIDAAIAAAAGATGTMKIDADPGLATGKLNTLVGNIGGTTGTMHIDSTVDKATGKLSSLVASITGTTASLKIDADPALADGKLRDLVARITGTTAVVLIDGDPSLFNAVMVGVLAPRTVTVTVNEVPGTKVGPNAMGHIRDASGAAFFAGGGFHNGMAKAMSAATARIVPPNTFRVIGDRAKGDEAFIPINSSARSRSLLGVTADRMGFSLVPKATPALGMASGGFLSETLRLAEAMKSKRISTQTSGSFSTSGSAGAAGTVLGALSGNGAKGVEARLDALIAATEAAPRGPSSITVEDRSGNPVETARATQLALRLAR